MTAPIFLSPETARLFLKLWQHDVQTFRGVNSRSNDEGYSEQLPHLPTRCFFFFLDVFSHCAEVEHLAAMALGHNWQRLSISATIDYSGADSNDKQTKTNKNMHENWLQEADFVGESPTLFSLRFSGERCRIFWSFWAWTHSLSIAVFSCSAARSAIFPRGHQ